MHRARINHVFPFGIRKAAPYQHNNADAD